MEARVAVLEQIAKDTKDILGELKLDMREMRQEMREMRHEMREMRQESSKEFASVRQDQKNDFRLLFGAIITLAIGLSGVMAHGFRWF